MPEGTKYDEGKVRLDLLPFDALWEVGKVYTMGAKKYDDRNWESGIAYGRVFAACCRHLWKWFLGETYDIEDGQHHLASVIWCGLSLLHYDLNADKYVAFDNRPSGYMKVWLQKEKPPEPSQMDLDFGGIGYGQKLGGQNSLGAEVVGFTQQGLYAPSVVRKGNPLCTK